ncbi:glycosyltransferase family 4 protein [Chitinophaga rhizophila]|uniref:Glycosyltransferase n=1 Tax=Chitinophaga rhizophila TaxID=2866212 RepID=A0ABS7G7M4_9BACT|nr:glycosyltransferase [Chitinophaga rhizophila]MBW8683658.1 glycosyltransferase [Chitinophaga rhizophila]
MRKKRFREYMAQVSDKQRILVYSTQLMETGGIESHLLEFCRQMAANGTEIDLVVLNANTTPETEQYYKSICRRVLFGKHGRSYKRMLWMLQTGVRLRSSRKYDAVYTNGQGESIWMLSRMLPGYDKWVHHHHTSGDAKDQATWGEKYKRTLQTANTIIACSHRNAGDMKSVLNRQIDVVPCFSRNVEVAFTQSPSGKLRFGYYGRLIAEKGVDLICRMSEDADLSDVEFHLWGEGKNYPASYFDKYPNVQYHGTFAGEAGLKSAIAQLDAYLLLSIHPEGLPISLLEAMSAGLPWLATDRGGIPDIACDPLSTRVIPAASTYEEAKSAVKAFAKDIRSGLVTKTTQKDLYANRFSAVALRTAWSNILGLQKHN